MVLDLYFISAISDRDEKYAPVRKGIVEQMRCFGTVLDEQVVRDDVFDYEASERARGVNIHLRDTSRVYCSSAGVAEASVGSFGGGGEIERFIMCGKPLLILQHQDVRENPYLSDAAKHAPNVVYESYPTLEYARSSVRDFLKEIKLPQVSGRFIVFDGPDGCGKSYQLELLANYLSKHPQDKNKCLSVLKTREPSHSHYGAQIRKIASGELDLKSTGMMMADLFVLDRWCHVNTMVIPAVASGCMVLSDRYKYSTLAYQAEQGVGMDKLLAMHEGMPVPDLVFFFDAPMQVFDSRMSSGRAEKDAFERAGSFQARVAENFRRLKDSLPGENIKIIDANRAPEQIFEDVKKHVDALIFAEVKR